MKRNQCDTSHLEELLSLHDISLHQTHSIHIKQRQGSTIRIPLSGDLSSEEGVVTWVILYLDAEDVLFLIPIEQWLAAEESSLIYRRELMQLYPSPLHTVPPNPTAPLSAHEAWGASPDFSLDGCTLSLHLDAIRGRTTAVDNHWRLYLQQVMELLLCRSQIEGKASLEHETELVTAFEEAIREDVSSHYSSVYHLLAHMAHTDDAMQRVIQDLDRGVAQVQLVEYEKVRTPIVADIITWEVTLFGRMIQRSAMHPDFLPALAHHIERHCATVRSGDALGLERGVLGWLVAPYRIPLSWLAQVKHGDTRFLSLEENWATVDATLFYDEFLPALYRQLWRESYRYLLLQQQRPVPRLPLAKVDLPLPSGQHQTKREELFAFLLQHGDSETRIMRQLKGQRRPRPSYLQYSSLDSVDLPDIEDIGGCLPPCLAPIVERGGDGMKNRDRLSVVSYFCEMGYSKGQIARMLPKVKRADVNGNYDYYEKKKVVNQQGRVFGCSAIMNGMDLVELVCPYEREAHGKPSRRQYSTVEATAIKKKCACTIGPRVNIFSPIEYIAHMRNQQLLQQ